MKSYKKTLVIMIFISFLLLTPLILSQNFSANKGFEWLISRGSNGDYGTISNTALATLALNKVGRDISQETNFLLSQKNPSQFCWPGTSCQVKATSLSIIALNDAGIDTSEGVTWLEGARRATSMNGRWFIQVKSQGKGECNVNFLKNNNRIDKNFEIVNGRFTACGNSTFLDIQKCVDSQVLNQIPNLEINVICKGISNPIIGLIFNQRNNYYLLSTISSTQALIEVPNYCYGRAFKSSCDYESTLYATWALKEVSNIKTPFFLIKEFNKNNNFEVAFLAFLDNDNIFTSRLLFRQGADGSLGFNVFNTALGVLAFKETQTIGTLDLAVDWLKSKQRSDGSWNGDIEDTAMTLFAAFTDDIEGGFCIEGETRSCPNQFGVCSNSVEKCIDGTFGTCDLGNITEYEVNEVTCDALDNDCDGTVDEGCECIVGETRACSANLGVCANATQLCVNGTFSSCNFGNITGFEVAELSCNDNLDNDCDGLLDFNDSDCGSCFDGIQNRDEEDVDCGGICESESEFDCIAPICNDDGICDIEFGETVNNCPEDCTTDDIEVPETTEQLCNNNRLDLENFEEGVDCGGLCERDCRDNCLVNDVCEVEFFEDANNCPEDCSCGDSLCDEYERVFDTCPQDCDGFEPSVLGFCGDGVCNLNEDEFTCSEDCEFIDLGEPGAEGGGLGFFGWLIILIILGLVGYGAFYAYKKYGRKKKKPSFPLGKKPDYKAFKDRKEIKSLKKPASDEALKARTAKIDRELEKSIEEAKKLIKGK